MWTGIPIWSESKLVDVTVEWSFELWDLVMYEYVFLNWPDKTIIFKQTWILYSDWLTHSNKRCDINLYHTAHITTCVMRCSISAYFTLLGHTQNVHLFQCLHVKFAWKYIPCAIMEIGKKTVRLGPISSSVGRSSASLDMEHRGTVVFCIPLAHVW